MDEKIITPESPEAATYRTDIRGWVSANGNFFGDAPGIERIARWAGATHCYCEECEVLIEKHRRRCRECSERLKVDRYSQLEKRGWDEVGPAYSETHDEYFGTWDEVFDFLENDTTNTLDGLRLVICEPVPYREVEYDYWYDNLPDDTDLPDEVYRAMDALNNALAAAGPASWTPGKYAVTHLKKGRIYANNR